jgi:hypothetical protein
MLLMALLSETHKFLWSKCFEMSHPLEGWREYKRCFCTGTLLTGCKAPRWLLALRYCCYCCCYCCCCIATVNTSSRALSETYTAICRHCISIVEYKVRIFSISGEFLNWFSTLSHFIGLDDKFLNNNAINMCFLWNLMNLFTYLKEEINWETSKIMFY